MAISITDREHEFALRWLAVRRGRGVAEALKFILRRELDAERRAFLRRSYGKDSAAVGCEARSK